LYYINTGKSKSQADVKKVTKYIIIENDIFGEKEVDITAKVEKEYKAYKKQFGAYDEFTAPNVIMNLQEFIEKNYPTAKKVEEILLNARLLSNDIIDSEVDVFCEEGEEYNSAKYIDQFNKRITPLLVCFSKNIRSKILITDPKDRQYFTEEESRLTSGEPNKETDQDTYEALMTMEDKEIKFWAAHPEFEIPFLDECNMNWEEILNDYNQRLEDEKNKGISDMKEILDDIIRQLKDNEKQSIINNGKLPKKVLEYAQINPNNGDIVSKQYPEYVLISLSDLVDLIGEVEEDEE
jgi:hypothetical protein